MIPAKSSQEDALTLSQNQCFASIRTVSLDMLAKKPRTPGDGKTRLMTFGHSHYPKGGALQVHEGLPRVSKFAVSDVGMINRPVLRAEGALVESRTPKKKGTGSGALFEYIFGASAAIIARRWILCMSAAIGLLYHKSN